MRLERQRNLFLKLVSRPHAATRFNPSLWYAMFKMWSKILFLILSLPTLMLVLYWSSELVSDHIISRGHLGKQYIYL